MLDGPGTQVDLAEEIKKRKERAKKFGLPTPVFAVEVRVWNAMLAFAAHVRVLYLHPSPQIAEIPAHVLYDAIEVESMPVFISNPFP